MRSTSRPQNGNHNKYSPSPAANGESAEYFTKPMGETDGTISPGAGGLNGSGGAKGVKRTRSLMQRIRAMVSNLSLVQTYSGHDANKGLKSQYSEIIRTYLSVPMRPCLGLDPRPVRGEPVDSLLGVKIPWELWPKVKLFRLALRDTTRAEATPLYPQPCNSGNPTQVCVERAHSWVETVPAELGLPTRLRLRPVRQRRKYSFRLTRHWLVPGWEVNVGRARLLRVMREREWAGTKHCPLHLHRCCSSSTRRSET
jgi:hypothetical protein